jgi:hypothetical protein
MEGKIIKKKFNVKLNNGDKIEQLLQETYDLACQQHAQLQNEINKVANTTTLNDLDIDGKEKYAKIMANYISLQQKSIAQKQDIAKLMAEVIRHGGSIKDTLEDDKSVPKTFDIAALKKLANDINTNENEQYHIK